MNNPAPARTTILFSGHDLKFIRNFVEYCQRASRYRVLIDHHPSHEITNPAKCLELLPSADIIFCEWCLGNARWYSRRKRPEQRLFIRLHHQEMALRYRYELDWDNVDALIFTNFPHYHRFCREQPEHRGKAVVIFCDVDCDALDQEKLPGAEFNLGLVGINPMRKRPDLALEILAKLRQVDSRYALFFKTRMPWEYKWLWERPHEREFFNHFFACVQASPHCNATVFDEHGEDMPLWYSKIGFLLSTSDHEGSHQAVAEAMAAGSIPVIRDWDGATPLYPRDFLFSSVDEAVDLIRRLRQPRFYAAAAAAAKAHAREHFSPHKVYDKLEALFADKAAQPSSVVTVNFRPAPAATVLPPVMVLGYLPAGARGGYRIRVEQEVRALTRHGIGVHLVGLLPKHTGPEALAYHRAELEALGGRVHLVPIANFFDIRLDEAAIGEELDTLQRIAEENHVRILHAEALYCTRIGLLLRERCPDLRVVFDCHGASPEEERMSGAHAERVAAMRDWERRALAEADLTVVVSEAMHDFYRKEYGLQELRHAVVPCCVAEERFADGALPATLRCLPKGRPVLVYLGTLAAWQCGEETLRLFAQLHRRNRRLFFLLLIPEADHAKARDLMAQYRISQTSVLLAELPHAQVTAALRLAHAGVLLRRAHPVNKVSSPTKFGEYLAAGVPVIMTDGIGDFSKLTAERGLGLVLEPRLLDLAEFPSEETSRILAFVRESKNRRRHVARHCRQVARQRLHWDAGIATLSEGYRELSRPREFGRSWTCQERSRPVDL